MAYEVVPVCELFESTDEHEGSSYFLPYNFKSLAFRGRPGPVGTPYFLHRPPEYSYTRTRRETLPAGRRAI